MKCVYCGSNAASPKGCTLCGATFSDNELKSEIKRLLIEKKNSNNSQKKWIEQDWGKPLFEILLELNRRGIFEYANLLMGFHLEISNIDDAIKDGEKAARAGNVKCQYILARIYDGQGNVQMRDYWMKKAESNGSADAEDFIEAENNPDISKTINSDPNLIKTIFTVIGVLLAVAAIVFKVMIRLD